MIPAGKLLCTGLADSEREADLSAWVRVAVTQGRTGEGQCRGADKTHVPRGRIHAMVPWPSQVTANVEVSTRSQGEVP